MICPFVANLSTKYNCGLSPYKEAVSYMKCSCGMPLLRRLSNIKYHCGLSPCVEAVSNMKCNCGLSPCMEILSITVVCPLVWRLYPI